MDDEPTREDLIARIADLSAKLDLAERNVKTLTTIIERGMVELPVELSPHPAQVTVPPITCDICQADLSGDRARMLLADGRITCAACTQLTPEQKIAPQAGGPHCGGKLVHRQPQ